MLPPSYAGQYFTETMDNTGDFTNAGIFGDVTYSLTDTMRVSAGLRYSFDNKTYSWQTFPEQIGTGPMHPLASPTIRSKPALIRPIISTSSKTPTTGARPPDAWCTTGSLLTTR